MRMLFRSSARISLEKLLAKTWIKLMTKVFGLRTQFIKPDSISMIDETTQSYTSAFQATSLLRKRKKPNLSAGLHAPMGSFRACVFLLASRDRSSLAGLPGEVDRFHLGSWKPW